MVKCKTNQKPWNPNSYTEIKQIEIGNPTLYQTELTQQSKSKIMKKNGKTHVREMVKPTLCLEHYQI